LIHCVGWVPAAARAADRLSGHARDNTVFFNGFEHNRPRCYFRAASNFNVS